MFYFMVEEKEDRFTLFKQGDERIFRQYYEKYYHALCLWVVRIIKEETRMHDIVQEAFIVLWNSRMIIESELHLKMFLYQVVRRTETPSTIPIFSNAVGALKNVCNLVIMLFHVNGRHWIIYTLNDVDEKNLIILLPRLIFILLKSIRKEIEGNKTVNELYFSKISFGE